MVILGNAPIDDGLWDDPWASKEAILAPISPLWSQDPGSEEIFTKTTEKLGLHHQPNPVDRLDRRPMNWRYRVLGIGYDVIAVKAKVTV